MSSPSASSAPSASGAFESQVQNEIQYQVPDWAGRPPSGFHLDVLKGDKLIQKLMIDEKRCYFFGRNAKLCDFVVDHASCSRVHAVLLYHRHLKRFFLVDLNSSHGTFVGKTQLEGERPQVLEMASSFHFGASTRRYVLRSKLGGNVGDSSSTDAGVQRTSDQKTIMSAFNLPQGEEELDSLTEYNTALNRRIAALPVREEPVSRAKRKRAGVIFDDEELIINPEDVDPSIGRFRNMVTTAVIPTAPRAKKTKAANFLSDLEALADFGSKSRTPAGEHHYHRPGDRADPFQSQNTLGPVGFGPISAKLGLALPNAAPDVDLYADVTPTVKPASVGLLPTPTAVHEIYAEDNLGPKKKKYAKEAWPGRKAGPGSHMLL